MLASMTGYGRAVREDDHRTITVEMKSVNNRYLDIDFNMPKQVTYMEDQIKRVITSQINRGKVNVTLTIDGKPLTETALEINWPLIEQYQIHMKDIAQKYNRPEDWRITEMLQWPGVLTRVEKQQQTLTFETLILSAIKEALDQLDKMRVTEGQYIDKDLRMRLEVMTQYIASIRSFVPEVTQQYHERLIQKMKAFLEGRFEMDEARILNEVAIYADKSDISEELLRFDSHTQQFLDIIDESEPKGRKLDFLIQEMNREINTIGAKSGSVNISRYVVQIKSECEKMREQIQNIE